MATERKGSLSWACQSIVTQLCHGLSWVKVQEENRNASITKLKFFYFVWNLSTMELCTRWGIHSPNLTWVITFLHGCAWYGHWDWIKACSSGLCGNFCMAETWGCCGEHIAQHLWCWMRLTHRNAQAMKHETCPSTRRVWLVRRMGNWMVCKRAMFVGFVIFDCK